MESKSKDTKISQKAAKVVEKLIGNKEQIYKWTGNPTKAYIAFNKSQAKIPERIFYELFDKGIISVYDASSF